MIVYPLKFKVNANSDSGISSVWKTGVTGSDPLTAAIPPEFGGPGGGLSPEDFYGLAILNCFCATFKVIAEKSKLEFMRVEISGELTVDRDERGSPWMSEFRLSAKVSGAADPKRALQILEKTSHSCIVLNSIKTVKTFEFEAV